MFTSERDREIYDLLCKKTSFKLLEKESIIACVEIILDLASHIYYEKMTKNNCIQLITVFFICVR